MNHESAVQFQTNSRIHMALAVKSLERSVAFYRTLFGVGPAKLRADYAKFELDDPPVVLSLEPTPRTGVGALNHAGFRMPDAASLVAMQERLDRRPDAMRIRRATVEHSFGTLKAWMGSTHFKTRPSPRSERR